VVTPGTLAIQDIPEPTPGRTDVVVKPAAVGICGTDLHIMDGEFAPAFPIVPGHEFAGDIVAVGADVTGYAVGDRVAVDPSLYCGHCYYCKRARGNQCENWNAIGVSVTGGAAEFVAAPMANLFKLPAHLAAKDAALIEPLSCAVRGFDVLPRNMASSYLIYGSGTMGLMMLQLAKRAGAESVSMVDLNPERLETAKQLGCSAAVTNADELDAPRGWDIVIDCTGVRAAIRDGLTRVGRGGTFLQFGVANYDTRVEIEPYDVYRREITITGSMAVLHSFDRAGQLLAAGVLDPGSGSPRRPEDQAPEAGTGPDIFVSHRYPLESYGEALAQFRAGIGRKILVEP
jgi:2-desacetyl-2-hydroxyethyl bacteriochlorophyllide A dehydrogenase